MTNVDKVGALVAILVLVTLVFFTIGYTTGWNDGCKTVRTTVRSTQFVVESANIEKVTTNTGLVIQNDGFNVGDTLVIIKK
jgi:hypothetical protein